MKPTPKRSAKPLVIAPGRYRTRAGDVVKVWADPNPCEDWQWMATHQYVGTLHHRIDGKIFSRPDPHSCDLVARIPAKRSRPPKPKRTGRKESAVRYHLNADLKWIADPKNQRVIKRMIQAAVKHMKTKSRLPAKARGRK